MSASGIAAETTRRDFLKLGAGAVAATATGSYASSASAKFRYRILILSGAISAEALDHAADAFNLMY